MTIASTECTHFLPVTSLLQLYTHTHKPVMCISHILKYVRSEKPLGASLYPGLVHASQGCLRTKTAITRVGYFIIHSSSQHVSMWRVNSDHPADVGGKTLPFFILQLLQCLPVKDNTSLGFPLTHRPITDGN